MMAKKLNLKSARQHIRERRRAAEMAAAPSPGKRVIPDIAQGCASSSVSLSDVIIPTIHHGKVFRPKIYYNLECEIFRDGQKIGKSSVPLLEVTQNSDGTALPDGARDLFCRVINAISLIKAAFGVADDYRYEAGLALYDLYQAQADIVGLLQKDDAGEAAPEEPEDDADELFGTIDGIIAGLEAAEGSIEWLAEMARNIASDEQDAVDNLPAGFCASERQKMLNRITSLENAADDLECFNFDDVVTQLEEAKEGA